MRLPLKKIKHDNNRVANIYPGLVDVNGQVQPVICMVHITQDAATKTFLTVLICLIILQAGTRDVTGRGLESDIPGLSPGDLRPASVSSLVERR